MSGSIRNNAVSQAAAGHLNSSQRALSRGAERLSSGTRVARAGDDAAGGAVAFHLSSQARSTRQAVRNANDGLSVLAVAEAANNTLIERLQRMRELTVQSANGVLNKDQRKYLQAEFQSLVGDIKDAAIENKFNGIGLTLGGSLDVQAGANQSDDNRINIELPDHKTIHLGIRLLSVNTQEDARSAMASVDSAMDRLNKFQAGVGSDMNRISASIRFATDQGTALTAASSRITDTDYALETANMTAQQIKSQASTAAIAQANGLARGVIGLIA